MLSPLLITAEFQSCPGLRGKGLPICCISDLVVAEASTGSGGRTPEKDGVSQLFREQLLGFYKVALRKSEAVMGNHRADTQKSTFLCRNVPEVSLNFSKIDEVEISCFHKCFQAKKRPATSTTLPTSGPAWELHRFQYSFQVPAAPSLLNGDLAHKSAMAERLIHTTLPVIQLKQLLGQ